MRKNFYFLILACFLFSFFVSTVPAQDNDKRKILSGFTDVCITVNSIPEEIRKEGLTQEQIDKNVGIKLKSSGIVVNSVNMICIYAPQSLDIEVNTVRINQGSFAFSINVSLKQPVILQRDKTASLMAKTWERNIFGVVGVNKISSLETEILRLVDEFINDYLKANPPNTSRNQSNTTNSNQSSPFTATYIGENRPPEVEVFNDTDRTLYLDFGQDTLTPYTIPPKTSKKFTLTEGLYKYKATAPRVVPLAGEKTFEKGYRYTWRFVIITRKIN